MSSTDKTRCSHLIKRRWGIGPVDAIFSSENRFDYLSTLSCGEEHTNTVEETVSLSSSAPPPSSFPFSPSADADILWHISLGCCHSISVMYYRWQAWVRQGGGSSVTSEIPPLSLRILQSPGWMRVVCQPRLSLTLSKGRPPHPKEDKTR